MSAINLVLGDQLFRDQSSLPGNPIVMVEDRKLACQFPYHAHKLILTFSAMRHFAMQEQDRVTYFDLDQGRTIPEVLVQFRNEGVTEIHSYEPADRFFTGQLSEWCKDTGLALHLHRNPMFLTSKEEWEKFSDGGHSAIMADFYRWQRRRLQILVDPSGRPEGGRWSFDEENRKRLPKGLVAPFVGFPEPDRITQEVQSMIAREFPQNEGNPASFRWPVTHEDADAFLQVFLDNRFGLFGDYEDAISTNQPYLFHSLISPLLNIGLLTPGTVIERVLENKPAGFNSLEGFVRQVIGWREFVRGVDREDRWRKVSLNEGRSLKDCWFRGTTGLPPLDDSIRRAQEFGWCHHIERLMVLGSLLFMCEVSPAEALSFFMKMFVDASEWVMGPNVLGMSQFVSPTFATKPYISGSAYILKMSDYKKGDWCEIWDGLYWRTIHRLRSRLATNPRMMPMLSAYDRMDATRRERIIRRADVFITETTS